MRMHYVLVPGAWHAGWAWSPVAHRIRQAGHSAVCLTLPGMGDGEDRTGLRLSDATEAVMSAVRRYDGDKVVLAGHSLGGLMISAAAAELGDALERLIFVDAFVPSPGQSMNDANPGPAREYVAKLIEASPAGVVDVPDYELAKSALMQDLSDSAARLLHQLLTPTPGHYFLDPYPGPEVRTLPVALGYVLAEHDHGLAVPGEELADRLGVEPVRVPGNHEALLTHPDQVAAAVLDPETCRPSASRG